MGFITEFTTVLSLYLYQGWPVMRARRNPRLKPIKGKIVPIIHKEGAMSQEDW